MEGADIDSIWSHDQILEIMDKPEKNKVIDLEHAIDRPPADEIRENRFEKNKS